MSLVPTWVRAVDGKWYKDPVIRGDDYFICFDDDDPVEIVVECRNRSNKEINARIDEIIKDFGKRIKFQELQRCGRYFGNDMKPKPAASLFFDLKRRIDVPHEFEAASDKKWPGGPGVYYDAGMSH